MGYPGRILHSHGAHLNKIVAEPAVTITAPVAGSATSTITATFPGQSITLLVAPD
jgi:hypothetical protein